MHMHALRLSYSLKETTIVLLYYNVMSNVMIAQAWPNINGGLCIQSFRSVLIAAEKYQNTHIIIL